MHKTNILPATQALLAAALFGASTPFAKMLLGEIEPVPLAALLYLGSGLSLLLFRVIGRLISQRTEAEAQISSNDIPWLIGAVFAGGVAAPIVLLFSLRNTPAATASLLLNFESVSTTLIAVLIFKEAIGRRVWLAIVCITFASILLTLDITGKWGVSIGAIGVITACAFWGLDNNFTRSISVKDPLAIVTVKGLGAGIFSLIMAIILHNSLPDLLTALKAMVLGCFSYGLSIVLFIHAMRCLGAARSSALFGTAPFAGVFLSFLFFHEVANVLFIVSLPFMLYGVISLLGEEHAHTHFHSEIKHEHRHCHNDDHHMHGHVESEIPAHSHLHSHKIIQHSHPHTPDIHHRHQHYEEDREC